MDKEIYQLKRDNRCRNISISVNYDGSVQVKAPPYASKKSIEGFVDQKREWIAEKIKEFSKLSDKTIIKIEKNDYSKSKEKARKIITQRVKYFNQYYRFKYEKIRIKKQKTLWGSCSEGGNLNFNYALIKLPREMMDYVIVHEMCHLWHFNHSKEFWKLVSHTIPDYKEIKKKISDVYFV